MLDNTYSIKQIKVLFSGVESYRYTEEFSYDLYEKIKNLELQYFETSDRDEYTGQYYNYKGFFIQKIEMINENPIPLPPNEGYWEQLIEFNIYYIEDKENQLRKEVIKNVQKSDYK